MSRPCAQPVTSANVPVWRGRVGPGQMHTRGTYGLLEDRSGAKAPADEALAMDA